LEKINPADKNLLIRLIGIIKKTARHQMYRSFSKRVFRAALIVMGLLNATLSGGTNQVPNGEVFGYLIVPVKKVPDSYNAGFSMYVAAWPLQKTYPGHRFQTGLFGTWMNPQYDGPRPDKLYTCIEGGLGWWRGTRFPTITPKFIIVGAGPSFSVVALAPGRGKGTWEKPEGIYGIAQLSPWVLFPPDGLNLKQGTRGELFGFGYLPLPLTPPKTVTAGTNIPTGENSWTLFLNTGNFKGPVAFITPYFWSGATVTDPRLSGKLLDSRPSLPDNPVQMETQYIPGAQATDAKGEIYARIAPTSFPVDSGGETIGMHRITSYDRTALWDGVKAWFAGGSEVSGLVDTNGSVMHVFPGMGYSTWKIFARPVPEEKKVPIDWKAFATPVAPDSNTFGFRWNQQWVSKDEASGGSLVTLPEYYHLVKDPTAKDPKQQWVWTPVRQGDVPAETGLAQVRFDTPQEKPQEPWETPTNATSCWKKPGPVAGPFQAHLGDGTVVTYSWYRFADQPAILNADLSDKEREQLQAKVETLHRRWKKDRDYLPPPAVGKLADLDPGLLVTPPPGLEVGYVPIVTRQALEK
jgi:hypothetical protein